MKYCSTHKVSLVTMNGRSKNSKDQVTELGTKLEWREKVTIEVGISPGKQEKNYHHNSINQGKGSSLGSISKVPVF